MTTKKKETGTEELQNEQATLEQASEKENAAQTAAQDKAPEPDAAAEQPARDKKENTTAAPTPEPAQETGKKGEKSIPQGMKPYFDNYPANRVFYRTTDGQVFLEKDQHLAANHQRSLKKGDLETIKR